MEFRRRLGYVPEEPHLYPFLSGRGYLQLIGGLRGIALTLLDRKIEAFSQLFGLSEALDQDISSYSKGMRQKVLISAALLHDPDVLVFDEPEAGLDVTTALVLPWRGRDEVAYRGFRQRKALHPDYRPPTGARLRTRTSGRPPRAST
jgi:ABC-type Na+ transport system ATPase subunit NatA